MEVGHDEHRILRTQAKERGDRDKRIGDGPVLDGCLEAAEVRERFRVREHGLWGADLVEGST